MRRMDKRPLRRILSPVRNERGVALLIAIFSLTLMVFIATEVSYDTNVEYVVASQGVNRLKAYYAARSGVEISLLRILIYKKALAAFGDQLGNNKSMLDPIWKFPLAWPPSKFIPEGTEVSTADREQIVKVEAESNFDAQYFTSIENESAKIDINDLGSSVKSVRESAKSQLIKAFAVDLENNEDFEEKFRDFKFEELVNHIIDWMDEDKESLNGGDESSYYPDANRDFVPPNQPLKTMDELHLIEGMTDDIYDWLQQRITMYGAKGIDINSMDEKLLRSLDSQINDDVIEALNERRNDPDEPESFASVDEFLEFLDGQGVNTDDFNKDGVPLTAGQLYNFRIVSTGEYAGTTREIEVVTYDIDDMVDRLVDLMEKEDEKNGKKKDEKTKPKEDGEDGKKDGETDPSKDPDKDKGKKDDKNKTKTPQGRPTIVYWNEK
jgi:general secretion pathway protein K